MRNNKNKCFTEVLAFHKLSHNLPQIQKSRRKLNEKKKPHIILE